MLQTLSANQANIDSNEDNVSIAYEEQDYMEEEPTGSIFGYNTLTRITSDNNDDNTLSTPVSNTPQAEAADPDAKQWIILILR